MNTTTHRGFAMSIRRHFLRFASMLLLALPLAAQVEPELRTVTDLTDVYQRDSGKPEMVCIYDFTTTSRGVFETVAYLTAKTRAAFVGGHQGVSNVASTVFAYGTSGKDFGIVFGLKVDNATKAVVPSSYTYALGGSNITVTAPEVWMWRWPQSATRVTNIDGVVITGRGFAFDAASGRMKAVPWEATDTAATWASRVSHVRFTVKLSSSVTRTIDLPSPTILFTNPAPAQADFPRRAADSTLRNFQQHHTDTGIVHDPWSDANPINTATPELVQGRGLPNMTTSVIIGNFYYPFDYLAFIFGSKKVRNADSSEWVNAPSLPTRYASSSGYAIPDAQEAVKLDTYPVSGTQLGEGWNNMLPVMTRYQAQKAVSINILLDFPNKLNWIYRFLAPAYPGRLTSDDGDSPEELGGASAPPANNGNRNSTKLRYLRRLLASDVASHATSLQNLGPSNWVPTTNDTMSICDFGNYDSIDPRSPQPWSYSLANTYYRLTVERAALTGSTATSVFEASNAACPGKTFVVPFPTHVMNDSYGTALNQSAAVTYRGYISGGNTGLKKGTYTEMPGAADLIPGNEVFFPGCLSSTAAFRKSTASLNACGGNTGPFGAPWNIGACPSISKIQTMVISLAIPGAFKFKSDNSNRDPHEWWFRVAQWSDPTRIDLGYGGWRQANGNPDDTDVVTGGKVRYYPSADPQALEDNFRDMVSYIVAGSAALSAPATPSTGARATSQAYFGIFRTSRTPAWSGNLFGIGMKRAIDPTTQQETLSFYGKDGESTIGCIPILDENSQPVYVNGQLQQICGLNDFDDHHLWSAFDVFGSYVPTEIPAGINVYNTVYGGTPLLWSGRKIYTSTPGSTTKVEFKKENSALVNSLVTRFAAASLFEPSMTPTARVQDVERFIDYYRGRNIDSAIDTTKNRIGIMGDIINSAPLAIEISSNLVGPMGISWPAGADPHVRLVIVGTNMGMLHCFAEQAYTDAGGYVKATATELWAFVPPDLLETMYRVYTKRNVADAFRHPYLVDGDPMLFHIDKPSTPSAILGDTRVSQGEDAIVVFGHRKGARSYYAIQLSSASESGVHPGHDGFRLIWSLDPQLATADATVKKFGMSTAIPNWAYVSTDGTAATKKPVIFLSGGYANAEVNARYRAKGTIGASEGMGQSILALNPYTGAIERKWDWSADATIGAIPAGVTPVPIFPSTDMVQRLYFADMNGNVAAINSNLTNAETNFRLDSSKLSSWISDPRYIYKNSAYRFTNTPDAFRLPGGYPALVVDTNSDGTDDYAPLTVMVSIGAGDRNNPTDKDETFVVGGTTVTSHPPAANTMLVLADRQDSGVLGRDTTGITNLITIPSSWTSYSSDVYNPMSDSYFWKTYSGYVFALGHGALPLAYNGVTHDKVLVSPLVKEGALFFSVFSIQGNTGFDCSANSLTRTFREVDITRPLYMNLQARPDQISTDLINDFNRNLESSSGLVFVFNSISSQLADTGDRVIQGGAVTSAAASYDQQSGANTPDIKTARSTTNPRGFRIRNWRVVR